MVRKIWLIFIKLILFCSFARAADSCPWIPTVGKSIEQIAQEVKDKSGKTPTVACGGGEDFKVCHSCADRLTDAQWSRIRLMLATPSYRNWHVSWHMKSNMETRAFAKSLNYAINENDAQGESFFYLHREIYRNVQANLAAMGLPCITPWTEIPKSVNDPVWPTIDFIKNNALSKDCQKNPELMAKVATFNAALSEKSQAIGQAHAQEFHQVAAEQDPQQAFALQDKLDKVENKEFVAARSALLADSNLTDADVTRLQGCPNADTFKDMNASHDGLVADTLKNAKDSYLRDHTMGAVGEDIESGYHTSLHFNYDSIQPEKCNGLSFDPECDSMGGPFSSHLNIHFYKVHGFIDQRGEKWLKLHGYDFARKDCGGVPKCYQWKSTYAGEPPDFATGEGCDLKKNVPLLLNSGTTPGLPSGPGQLGSPFGMPPGLLNSAPGQLVPWNAVPVK